MMFVLLSLFITIIHILLLLAHPALDMNHDATHFQLSFRFFVTNIVFAVVLLAPSVVMLSCRCCCCCCMLLSRPSSLLLSSL